MGRVANAVLPFVSPVAGAIMGARQERRAERRANQQAEQHNAEQRNIQAQARAENDRMNRQIQSSQERINATRARGARRRIRGGLFGDAGDAQAQPQGVLNPRLG